MKLSRLNLSSVIAVAHTNGHLQLLLNRGDELELLEIEAPVAVFAGLQELNEIVAEATALPPANESIAMLPINSSMANAVGYDADMSVLQIEFRNGAVYQYAGVEPEVWQDLHDTNSVGKYFNNEIRGNYLSSRIYENDCDC
ncbi:KTSC domain-containing protein [Calothrix sp. UHCC 0171]|uniref:KTSC domain-containing protein n=1 Tax=Calothrix sp. UHCC 0171 TaxID=3110245 RepID=UPI002B211073|nr:KTSC domain-containing protein [Calothrix sp. UHCC 0171]MEA5572503.1 KTSC domain-containing protein [Calothrix sp. UHCC 0171]